MSTQKAAEAKPKPKAAKPKAKAKRKKPKKLTPRQKAKRKAKELVSSVKDFIRPPNRDQLGRKTNFNLYRLHPVQRLLAKGTFLTDDRPEFVAWLHGMRKRDLKRAVILGNAPCLKELTPEQMDALRAEGFFSIGLNRSVYQHPTDVLIWSDLLTIDELLKKGALRDERMVILHAKLERDHRVKAAKDRPFQNLHRYWSRHKNFRKWPKTKLYMFRNSAVAALHLCYRLGIQDVLMVGFGFDDRSYFYSGSDKPKSTAYEIISEDKLAKNCGGYDTQKIVQEVVEYLVQDEGMRISFSGPSEFLRTVNGIEHLELTDPPAFERFLAGS